MCLRSATRGPNPPNGGRMTRFRVSLTLVCPSDWTEEKVREYLHRIAVTDEEKSSIAIETGCKSEPLQEEYAALLRQLPKLIEAARIVQRGAPCLCVDACDPCAACR